MAQCRAKGWSDWRIAYGWSALRNSVDNLKYVPWINPPIVDATVVNHAVGRGRLCWHLEWWSGYSCLYFPLRGSWYRIGWRLTGPGFTAEKI
jgi:hypothetical protein